MQHMHLRVEEAVNDECCGLLMSFLGGVDGVEAVQVERKDIWIRYNEDHVSPEQLHAMTRSSVELLGYRLSYA